MLNLVGRSLIRGSIDGDLTRERHGMPQMFYEGPEDTMTSIHYGWAESLGSSYPVDVGATTQHRVDDHVTVFHFGQLPEDFMVLPDS